MYLLDMSPIEHEWDFISQRLACDSHPTASTDEFWVCLRILNAVPQADIPNLLGFMLRHIAALIASSGGYIKY